MTLSQPTAESEQVHLLRRSKRKRNVMLSTPSTTAKMSRKSITSFSSPVPAPSPSLISLPQLVIRKLLLYCDVDTLEKLSKTCFYFDQLILGRFITSLDFPLPLDFINEVASTSRLEKKPLLKLRYKKADKILFSSYMFQSQMSFLFLNKIRELDLVPNDMMRAMNYSTQMKQEKFCISLLSNIKR